MRKILLYLLIRMLFNILSKTVKYNSAKVYQFSLKNTTTEMVIVHCTLYTDLVILYKNRVEIVIFWVPEISVRSLHGYLLKNQCRKP